MPNHGTTSGQLHTQQHTKLPGVHHVRTPAHGSAHRCSLEVFMSGHHRTDQCTQLPGSHHVWTCVHRLVHTMFCQNHVRLSIHLSGHELLYLISLISLQLFSLKPKYKTTQCHKIERHMFCTPNRPTKNLTKKK